MNKEQVIYVESVDFIGCADRHSYRYGPYCLAIRAGIEEPGERRVIITFTGDPPKAGELLVLKYLYEDRDGDKVWKLKRS